MNSKIAHLLWFMYRFPKRFFKFGINLIQCFKKEDKENSKNTLKSDSELLALGLTKQEIQAWRSNGTDPLPYQEVIDWLENDPLNGIMDYDDALYPESLRAIKDPPPLLFYRGNRDLLNKTRLAVVGSRLPSCYGRRVVQEWVSEIAANYPIVIVSGFAYGIDYLAHQAALGAQGATVAVLGSGLMNIYPKPHAHVWSREQLMHQALMLSEFPLNFPIRSWLFPYRNRVISGLSQAILVVEAKIRSGTLITARLAAEQGREVMAVPGSIHNPLSAGCHLLLKQGAALVSSVDDLINILSDLDPALQKRPMQDAKVDVLPDTLECNTKKLLDCLEFGVVSSIEEILARTGFDLLEVKRLLIQLEEKGLVQELVDGYTRIK